MTMQPIQSNTQLTIDGLEEGLGAGQTTIATPDEGAARGLACLICRSETDRWCRWSRARSAGSSAIPVVSA